MSCLIMSNSAARSSRINKQDSLWSRRFRAFNNVTHGSFSTVTRPETRLVLVEELELLNMIAWLLVYAFFEKLGL